MQLLILLQRMQVPCHLNPTPLTRMNQKTQRPEASLMPPKIYHIPKVLGVSKRIGWATKVVAYGARPHHCRLASLCWYYVHAPSTADCPSRRQRGLHSIVYHFATTQLSEEADHATHNKGSVHTCWRASQQRHMHKAPWQPVPRPLPTQDQGTGANPKNPRRRRLHHRITVNL